ncbi:BldC family transcriptional regulator [Allonocardiopsis opalescens]|uniref:Excisionase family DNA binding protein n=1 Tax=Allonocardiopsis opalescens TaxID=1144618 RepID=A0A2T0QCI4_9ACTN|nr:excisionase family DNA binding protein [Allonocardiopsis opalescens]
MPVPAMVPLGEAARLTGRTPEDLKEMAETGEVFAVHVSGHYYFDPARLPEHPPLPEELSGELPELMTAQEVAHLFRVHPKTVTSWARQGRLTYLRTLGGHRRYSADDVRALLDQQTADDEAPPPDHHGQPAENSDNEEGTPQ